MLHIAQSVVVQQLPSALFRFHEIRRPHFLLRRDGSGGESACRVGRNNEGEADEETGIEEEIKTCMVDLMYASHGDNGM